MSEYLQPIDSQTIYKKLVGTLLVSAMLFLGGCDDMSSVSTGSGFDPSCDGRITDEQSLRARRKDYAYLRDVVKSENPVAEMESFCDGIIPPQ